jgi:hypothetical protein
LIGENDDDEDDDEDDDDDDYDEDDHSHRWVDVKPGRLLSLLLQHH